MSTSFDADSVGLCPFERLIERFRPLRSRDGDWNIVVGRKDGRLMPDTHCFLLYSTLLLILFFQPILRPVVAHLRQLLLHPLAL